MTKEDIEAILGAKNLARWERMAGSNGISSELLAEVISAKVNNLIGAPETDMDLGLYAPVSRAEGNVINVDFKAAPRKIRSSYRGLERRSESRVGLMKIMVPSTSPAPHPADSASIHFGPFHVT